MRGDWDQIGQHATCPTKYKSKSKNQNLPCQQAQNSDLIDFQIPFQFDLKKIFQHPWSHQVTHSLSQYLAQLSHMTMMVILGFKWTLPNKIYRGLRTYLILGMGIFEIYWKLWNIYIFSNLYPWMCIYLIKTYWFWKNKVRYKI